MIEARTEVLEVVLRGRTARFKLIEYPTGRALRHLAKLVALLGAPAGTAGDAAAPAFGVLGDADLRALMGEGSSVGVEQLTKALPQLAFAKLGDAASSLARRVIEASGDNPLALVAEYTEGAAYLEREGKWRSLTALEIESNFGTDVRALLSLLVGLLRFQFGEVLQRTPTSGDAPAEGTLPL